MSSNASVRLLSVAGALLAGAAVALSAYAAHGVEGAVQARLNTAAAFAFGHGLALAALVPQAASRPARVVLTLMLAGALLFCGGVVSSALLGRGGGVAPFGGILLIMAWLGQAVCHLSGAREAH